MGPSGCGKTTLLRLINGLIPTDDGTVRVMGAAPEPGPDLAMVFHWRPADMDPMSVGELMDWRERARERYERDE